jgi:hypothetical protein
MVGWGRRAATKKRANQIERMVALIKYGMRTKTYKEFAESFSNPGSEADPVSQSRKEAHFVMRFSRKCWYDATAAYGQTGGRPFINLLGQGDDFGVFVTADPFFDGATADLHLESGQIAGRDAQAVVRALQAMPDWNSFADVERLLSGLI